MVVTIALLIFFSLQTTYAKRVYASVHKIDLSIVSLVEASNGESIKNSSRVRGIFSLMKVMEPINPYALKLPFVEGVSIRARWSKLEPEQGYYDWAYLDEVLNEVKKENKKAMLRILPGASSPKWIYDSGIKTINGTDRNPRHKTFGKDVRIPVPWDDNYIKKWITFIEELGNRYGSREEIALIHVSGPTVASAEFHLPKKRAARAKVLEAGYTKENLVKAWNKTIDAFADAFPGKPLALNISIPFRNDGAMEEIVEYCISKVEVCHIQGNWLSARTSSNFRPFGFIADSNRERGTKVGFQMLGASINGIRQGALDIAVQKGLNAGAGYFEIYQVDILEDKYRKFLEELNEVLVTEAPKRTSVTFKSTIPKTSEEALWLTLQEQAIDLRMAKRTTNIIELKKEILEIRDTVSKIQVMDHEQGEKFSEAITLLDDTIRFIDSGNSRGAKKSIKNAFETLKSIVREKEMN